MVELALGLGILVNLVFTEIFGLASGGLVVPGYLALYAREPTRVLATLGVAGLTWAAVRFGLMRVMILYGRRRFGVTVLTGFLLHAAYTASLGVAGHVPADLRAIGFIVPGLIANTALSQGLWTTFGMTLVVAAIVRLIMAGLSGWIA